MTEIKYTHQLGWDGRCTCGEFSMNPAAPGFTKAADKHFRDTTEKAVRDQTGIRGWVNKLRGRS